MAQATNFRISPLPIEEFTLLFDLTDEELRSRGMRRLVADSVPGYPCRVSLEDAAVGETILLLPYEHHRGPGPYRSSGPIFVRERATPASLGVNEVPESVRGRYLSVRAYNAKGMLVESDVTEGRDLAACVSRFFADDRVDHLHLHHARPGCYSCRVDRA